MVLMASLYTVAGYMGFGFGFLQIQVRVADALYPLIAVFGLPSLYGLVLGHFLVNLSSPLGFIDLLSVPLFLPAKYMILKFGFWGVPFHVLSVGLWVAYMLEAVLGLPFLTSFIYVTIGELIAEVGLGYPLYRGVKSVQT